LATDLDAAAERLFEGVMAPLVLSGSVRPGHAIGARAALGFGEGREPADRELASRVDAARVRRARRLTPIDALPGPTGADWALAAAFHDLLQAANPAFDAPLRRSAAIRILDLAVDTIERTPSPATIGEALSRHTWLARAPDVTRTDTEVVWWAGAREFRGVDPPGRLQAWPRLRAVRVTRTGCRLLELSPIALDRARLASTISALLSRTPLTDLATCTRAAPPFVWRPGTLAFVATRAGRTLALRALARPARADVDAALGRATRDLLLQEARGERARVVPAVSLLADRAIAEAGERVASRAPRTPGATVTFAQALGAMAARRSLAGGEGPWSAPERAEFLAAISQDAESPGAADARGLFERSIAGGGPPTEGAGPVDGP
jgi:hypothetical protein